MMTRMHKPSFGSVDIWLGCFSAGVLALGCGSGSMGMDDDQTGSVGQALTTETRSGDAVAPTPSSRLPVPILNWQPCGDDFPGIQCAVAQVPLDYDEPRFASTRIALARVPAADRAQRIGSVFVNPGGPGGSGVQLVLNGFGDYLGYLLGGRFDVVGFDPRGVAASEPLVCFDSNEELNQLVESQPAFPYRPRQERPFFDLYRSLAPKCFERHPRIAPHMSTADVVRDLDLLRQAVGDRNLTYLGFSYGSYIGNTYANLFPDRVRALVIDGVLDPQLFSSGREIVADRVASGREFAEFLKLCDEAASDCALTGKEGAAARFYTLAAALQRRPIMFDDGSSFGYDDLVGYAQLAMYNPEEWGGAQGYAALLAALADAVLGDANATRQAFAVKNAIRARLEQASPRREPYDNSAEAYFGNHCADAQYPHLFADWRTIGDYAARGSIFGPSWWWFNAGCADWPVSHDRYVGPWTATTSAPVLIVGNFFDGITDYAGAVTSSKLLPNSRLLSYAGWGHTAFGRSSCVTDYVAAYLTDGTLPPEGTVCPANPNPFLPVPAQRHARSTPNPAAMIGQPPSWMGALR